MARPSRWDRVVAWGAWGGGQGGGGEVAGQRKRIEGLSTELAIWRSRWNAAVTGIGLAESVEPEEAEARLALFEELFSAIDGAHRASDELLEKQGTVDRYSEEVSE